MGGRGASSRSASAEQQAKGIEERIGDLEAQVKSIEKRMDSVGEELAAAWREYEGHDIGAPWGSPEGEGKYFRAIAARDALSAERLKLLEQLDAEREKLRRTRIESGSERTFVNSYGEATRRYVTTDSYERAQRRMERETRSRMSHWR